jgi:hypothetical protein
MQECILCKKNLDLILSSYAEHFRQHEKVKDGIKYGGKLSCGFCGSEYLNVEKLLQHLVAFHQASEPRIPMPTSILPSLGSHHHQHSSRSSGLHSNNQSIIDKSTKVLLMMDQDKKVDASLKKVKEKMVEQIHNVVEGYKSNMYISDYLSNDISKSLLESISMTIQLMGNVIKETSLKDYSDKISSIHDEIILSFADNLDDDETSNDNIKHELSVFEQLTSEFSPAPAAAPVEVNLPSTSTSIEPSTASSFDPLPAFNLFINRPPIVLDASINAKEGFKKLAFDMIAECQGFYDSNKLEEPELYCGVDIYEQFNSPFGRIILYVLYNDSNPEFSKDLITIAWKEAYGILRTILKIVKPSLDYRPKDLDPLVLSFLKFIGKEGPNNEIAQAETKKILHQWIRTTRHRNKDNNDANINATIKITSVRKKRRAPTEDTIESIAAQAETLIPDISKILSLFRRSSSMRFEWIENPSTDIHTALETFPVIKMFPKQLIDVDYEELCRIKKWEYISIVDEMQRIFPALKYLLQSYNVTTLPGHLNQNDTFANVFFSFPNLFHHFLNNSKKIPKQFYFESASQDFLSGVNRIINEKQVQHNFFGRIDTPDGQIIFVYINGHILRIEGSLLEALELYYRIHYVFRIERPASIFFLTSWLDLLCKKKVETNCGPQRFMREIERLCKQYSNFPESRNAEFF